ncbi:MAG: hypothetical protein IJI32_00530 [Clostridia bacterium]|nr:hypothetical protein [Clostridia bacterium]MBQ3051592.1 hypothetical protein [Clostridia bacterium]MBQ6525093.1 hypothetical protein [Clostridia bacterium]
MNKLRDLFSSLTALRDWQDEVERNATKTAPARKAPAEPVIIKRDALILDLCAYREKRASA